MYFSKYFLVISFLITLTLCEVKYNIDCKCNEESQNGKFCQEWTCNEEEDTGSCFPQDSYAFDLNYNQIKMKDLAIGDKVISISTKGEIYEDEIIGFLHLQPQEYQNYLEIQTESSVITITGKHVIIKANNEITTETQFLPPHNLDNLQIEFEFPLNLQLGDKLMVINSETHSPQWEKITKISQSNKLGMYAPLTTYGTLLVDGIAVSCYANFKYQQIANFMFYPYKLLQWAFPDSNLVKNNAQTGILEYADLLMQLSSIMPEELNYQQQQ